MFMMSVQQNMSFGYNPFIGGYNPRLNFFLGMAGATAGISMPIMPMMTCCPCSVFNPYMSMSSFGVQSYGTFGGFGGFGSISTFQYQPQTFTYTPQSFTSNPFVAPVFNTNFTSGITTSTTEQTTKSPSSAQTTSETQTTTENEDTPTPQGIKLKNKGQGTQYGPEFLKKVKQIAKNLNCNYRDLLAIMNSESGINANIIGSNGASGLICFMPKYYDVAAIRKMSPLEQLDLVEKAFKDAKKRAGFADNAKLKKGDLYALIFLPARAGNEVLCRKGERDKNGKLLNYYESNAALDYNKDGKITKEEMAHRIDKKYVSDYTFIA